MQVEDNGGLARGRIHGKDQASAVDSGLMDVRATTNRDFATEHASILPARNGGNPTTRWIHVRLICSQ